MTDGRFLRGKAARNLLWLSQDGKCAGCGEELPPVGWHADHVLPFSKGGRTNVHEMQALCAECNLRKGDTVSDRKHQAELRQRVKAIDNSDLPVSILVWAAPGGGKSRLPGILAERFPHFKVGWFVPRLTLQIQAVECMARDFGLKLRDAGNDVDPSRGTRGFVATHAALMEQPSLWRDEFKRHPYILVLDESHHSKVERDGGYRPLAAALERIEPPPVTLFMTGTLDTNDNSLLHRAYYRIVDRGFEINPEQSADIYIRYDRKTALRERALVPIEFHHHDGPVRWKKAGQDEQESRLSDVKKGDEASAIFTALRTDIAVQLFESGLAHWRRHASGKLLVVTDRQATAREYHKRLESAGVRSVLAIDENETAHADVRRFRCDPGSQALVTCQMAYEGLDVPALSHVVCLTHIRSAPWIEQMLARVWRAAAGKTRCWAFVPDDPRMNRVIEKIASEQPDVVPDYGEGPAPSGTEREPTLALNGAVDLIRQQYLDGSFASDETKSELLRVLQPFGVSEDDPEFQALLGRVMRPKIPPSPPTTVREEEARIRNQIAEQCRSIDAERANRRDCKPNWGEAQRQLLNLTGKPIGEMTINELKHAHTKLQDIRPR